MAGRHHRTRAKVFARELPMAMHNLQIAQHRDQLRYATTRSGGYPPRQRRFEVGDYVYVRRQQQTTLDTGTNPRILARCFHSGEWNSGASRRRYSNHEGAHEELCSLSTAEH